MKENSLCLLFLLLTSYLVSQSVYNLETFNLPLDSFLNGSDGRDGLESNGITLSNDYNAQWMSWSGWAISTMTDANTRGIVNQYAAITGRGVDHSRTYATAYEFAPVRIALNTGQEADSVYGVYLTNSTYAYWAMKEGDSFAKKFGGPTGTDPDYFYVHITKYLDGEWSADSVTFYLADFRSDDAEDDYIINEWTWVDLSSLGRVDSLEFTLRSSDKGQFGINTPLYFCLDNLTTNERPTRVKNFQPKPLIIFPNPTTDILTFPNHNEGILTVINPQGILVHEGKVSHSISLKHLPSGTYQIILRTQTDVFMETLTKL